MKTPPRTRLARLPTPLMPMDRLRERVGGPRIWIKRDDLTDTAACGNKLRKLEYTIGQALSENADVLITCGGVQSNHCRATAVMASQLGLKSHLILRGKPTSPADGNLLLDQLLGAGITFASAAEYAELDGLRANLEQKYLSEGMKPFFIPVGASDEIGLWGYIGATAELKRDFARLNITPGYIVSATGSGGTLGGLILGRYLNELAAEMFAFNVCDDEAYFLEKIANDIDRWQARYEHEIKGKLAINVIDGYVGPGYGRADTHVFDTIRSVAQTEGIILDPVYTGKAFDAMLTEIQKGRFNDTSDIVFIHTGGIFGLFPQRNQL